MFVFPVMSIPAVGPSNLLSPVGTVSSLPKGKAVKSVELISYVHLIVLWLSA